MITIIIIIVMINMMCKGLIKNDKAAHVAPYLNPFISVYYSLHIIRLEDDE